MKDTVVSGSLRATDTLYSTTAQFQILRAPTTSNGTTYGPGTANNLLKSNGNSIYWTTLATSDIPTISIADKTSGTLTIPRGGTGATDAAGARTNLGVKALQSNVSSPTASGNSISYIDTISQNTQGVISATKKTIPEVTQSESGLMIPDDKIKLDDIETKKQVRTVSIEPAQDLHGYDNPWPVGGGKNKLPLVSFPSSTVNDVTCIVVDGMITATGTASAGTNFAVIPSTAPFTLKAGTYTLSVTGNSNAVLQLRRVSGTPSVIDWVRDTRASTTFDLSADEECWFNVNIQSGTTMDVNCKVQLESGSTATSWTPYSNICPINGWTGANVTRTGKVLVGFDFTFSGSGYTYRIPQNIATDMLNAIKTLGSGTYKFGVKYNNIGTTDTRGIRIVFTDNSMLNFSISNTNSSGYWVGTVGIMDYSEKTVNYAFAYFGHLSDRSDPVDASYSNLIIERITDTPDIDDAYQGTTHDITFPSEAGTVYGGTLDVTTGVLTVDKEMIVLDGTQSGISPNWRSFDGTSAWLYRRDTFPNIITSQGTYVLCDTLPNQSYYSLIYNGEIGIDGVGNNYWSIVVRIPVSGLTTIELINQYLSANPIHAVFKLATPQTYQLTPTEILLLTNEDNVWADTGEVTLQSYLVNNATNVVGVIDVSHGGTSATTASEALLNLGAAAVNHTHNYAGSSSVGGSANSVANSLTLKINTPSTETEGTNTYTFNGSAAKTLDIKAGSNISLTASAGTVTIANTYSYNLPTAATGTKGGIKVGSGLTMNGEILNHSNSITAQTTQALYPIKIDAQGHISSYGEAITPVTKIKGNAESSYRTGQVNLTAENLGAVAKDAELLTTNHFAPSILRGPYISKIDNAFYAADKRWNITATNNSSSLRFLFDGNYETQFNITQGTSTTITMDFSNVGHFPGYPYGYILISFYSRNTPANITGRVYCDYEPHGIGWHDLTFSQVNGSDDSHIVYKARQGVYNITTIEITITASSSIVTGVTQIEMHLDRPDSSRTPFLSKYGAETLYYNLTAPSFIGSGASLTSLNASNISSGTVAIEHGGTGATTAAQARTNLGITPANIGAVAKSGDTMTGLLTISHSNARTTYNDGTRDILWVGKSNATNASVGLHSLGYYNENGSWTDNATYIAYRASGGDIYLNGRANSLPDRTLTIGSTGKTFNGTGNVSWSLAEIGATVSNTWTNGTTAGPTIKTTVNGVTGTAVAIPSAGSSQSGIVTTGEQAFRGLKFFDANAIAIRTVGDTIWPCINFGSIATIGDNYTNTDQDTWNQLYTQNAGKRNSDNKYAQNRFFFRSYSDNGAGSRIDHYEDYYLPLCDRNLTDDQSYSILTTKDMSFNITGNAANVTGVVNVINGGTGANTPAGAKNNLGLGSAAMDFSVVNYQGDLQYWGINAVVQNNSNGTRSTDILNKRMALIAQSNGILCYDATNDSGVWALHVVLTKSVSGRTDANGNINLGISADNFIVIGIKINSYIAIPWASGADNNWHARIIGITGTAYANADITATVYYKSVPYVE